MMNAAISVGGGGHDIYDQIKGTIMTMFMLKDAKSDEGNHSSIFTRK
jgi:hypothetical protein